MLRKKLFVGRVYLITAYARNVGANLTQAQRNEMPALTARLERES